MHVLLEEFRSKHVILWLIARFLAVVKWFIVYYHAAE